ncbi:hypothetical protein CDAR_54221 [Caerostris darwini]|uniref:Uncharacterized protein n=1 Tax=Caerostris darwini TaxID=1538125 RepID=A0AAV4Q7T8_9ARAC|nr:hypothetical protein CDAR_54221 [Caerostris darwini]
MNNAENYLENLKEPYYSSDNIQTNETFQKQYEDEYNLYKLNVIQPPVNTNPTFQQKMSETLKTFARPSESVIKSNATPMKTLAPSDSNNVKYHSAHVTPVRQQYTSPPTLTPPNKDISQIQGFIQPLAQSPQNMGTSQLQRNDQSPAQNSENKKEYQSFVLPSNDTYPGVIQYVKPDNNESQIKQEPDIGAMGDSYSAWSNKDTNQIKQDSNGLESLLGFVNGVPDTFNNYSSSIDNWNMDTSDSTNNDTQFGGIFTNSPNGTREKQSTTNPGKNRGSNKRKSNEMEEYNAERPEKVKQLTNYKAKSYQLMRNYIRVLRRNLALARIHLRLQRKHNMLEGDRVQYTGWEKHPLVRAHITRCMNAYGDVPDKRIKRVEVGKTRPKIYNTIPDEQLLQA